VLPFAQNVHFFGAEFALAKSLLPEQRALIAALRGDRKQMGGRVHRSLLKGYFARL
jgi:hypothetical protein